VFDLKNAQVGTLPKPILTGTYKVGSVWKGEPGVSAKQP